MNKRIFLISLVLAISILIVQVGGVYAASETQAFPPLQGTVQSITLETDASTGITTVVVEMQKGQEVQTVRINQETAIKLGFLLLDGDGKPVINDLALGKLAEIELTLVLPEKEEQRHPVGDALATFFFEGLGVENDEAYDTIMDAHESGVGFGVIAQVLWLTNEIPDGSLANFQTLLTAKQNNDYAGLLEDGSTPKNWAELRKAILEGKEVKNLGSVMRDNNNNGNDQPNNSHSNKEKEKDKNNNGNGGNNGKGNGNNK